MFSLESVIFLCASLISIGVVYFNLPKNILFVSLSIILALMLVLYNKFPLSYLQQKEHHKVLLIILFLSGLFIQLLLIATGGFFSAFIIILHLFTLGMSFVFNVRSAMAFLMLSLGVLISTVLFDAQVQTLFQNDPWSFILHGISFVIIIPLAHLVVSAYHMKDSISKMLTEHLETKEQQDESIFRGIGEFVIIVDKKLKVVFANEALKKSLGLETSELIGESIFSVLPLQDQSGSTLDSKTLSIDQAIADRSVHMVKGLSILPRIGGRKMQVLVQVRPIFETNGNIKQIVLVLTPDLGATATDEIDGKMLLSRRNALKTELERELINDKDPKALQHFMILMAQIDDILMYQEIETHGIIEHKALVNGNEFLKNTLENNKKLLTSFQITVDFSPSQEDLVKLATKTGLAGFSLYSHVKKSLLISTDQYYLQTMLEKVIRLLTILNTSSQDKKLIVRTGFNDTDEMIYLFAVQAPTNIATQANQLFSQNYGELNKESTLVLGSGMEGLLAKRIAELTGCKVEFIFSPTSGYLQAIVALPKNQ